ncbi:MAG: hypothetical protein IJN96_02945 [Clostridia bacterium]|nr:hypothetical protein [Clostridia bacterium]
MATVNEKMTAIADAIRDKTKRTEPLSLDDMATEIPEVYEAGKDAQYNEFWDGFQQKGLRNDYAYACRYWDFEYIRPRHKVVPTAGGMAQIFLRCSNLKKVESKYFDFSKLPTPTGASTGNYYTFQFCSNLEEIEDIKMRGEYYSGTFHSCEKLHTIARLKILETTAFSANPFFNCYELANITIDGIIGTNGFDVHWSTKLSRNSILSILEACKKENAGVSITLPKKCIDANTDTLTLIEGDSEMYSAYTTVLENGYTVAFA